MKVFNKTNARERPNGVWENTRKPPICNEVGRVFGSSTGWKISKGRKKII